MADRSAEIIMKIKDQATDRLQKLQRVFPRLGATGKTAFSNLSRKVENFTTSTRLANRTLTWMRAKVKALRMPFIILRTAIAALALTGKMGFKTLSTAIVAFTVITRAAGRAITWLRGKLRLLRMPLLLLGGATGWAVKQFADFETQSILLAQVLKVTGGAAGYTHKELLKMADGLQKVTKYSNTAVMQAQGLMATFMSIGREIFPQAIEMAADMSTMFGQDMKQSVIQLGKALNEPITGVARLMDIGVMFNAQQKEQIDTFMAANNIIGAQTVILDELKREIGGLARVLAETTAGSLAQLWNAFGDTGRMIGQALAPGLIAMADNIRKKLEESEKKVAWFAEMVVIDLGYIKDRIGLFFTGEDTWLNKWKRLWNSSFILMKSAGWNMAVLAHAVGEDIGVGIRRGLMPELDKLDKIFAMWMISQQAFIQGWSREEIARRMAFVAVSPGVQQRRGPSAVSQAMPGIAENWQQAVGAAGAAYQADQPLADLARAREIGLRREINQDYANRWYDRTDAQKALDDAKVEASRRWAKFTADPYAPLNPAEQREREVYIRLTEDAKKLLEIVPLAGLDRLLSGSYARKSVAE